MAIMMSMLFLLVCVCVYRAVHGYGYGGRGCEYNGKFYPNGADIYRDKNNCYGMTCQNGSPINWDGYCHFYEPPYPGGVNVKVEGQCCPKCVTSSGSWTYSVHGCEMDGVHYESGTVIQNEDPCEKCVCSLGGFRCERVVCSGADSSGIIMIKTDRFSVLNFILGIVILNSLA